MKLMIVEDELLCRENLMSIEWDSIGVTLADSACSATEAIEKIKDNPPDITASMDSRKPRSHFHPSQWIKDLRSEESD